MRRGDRGHVMWMSGDTMSVQRWQSWQVESITALTGQRLRCTLVSQSWTLLYTVRVRFLSHPNHHQITENGVRTDTLSLARSVACDQSDRVMRQQWYCCEKVLRTWVIIQSTRELKRLKPTLDPSSSWCVFRQEVPVKEWLDIYKQADLVSDRRAKDIKNLNDTQMRFDSAKEIRRIQAAYLCKFFARLLTEQ